MQSEILLRNDVIFYIQKAELIQTKSSKRYLLKLTFTFNIYGEEFYYIYFLLLGNYKDYQEDNLEKSLSIWLNTLSKLERMKLPKKCYENSKELVGRVLIGDIYSWDNDIILKNLISFEED